MITVMVELNRVGAEVMEEVGAHACTDITGFGLLGHALEMAKSSQCRIVLKASRVPILSFAREYAQMGLVPAGTYANRDFCHQSLTVDPGHFISSTGYSGRCPDLGGAAHFSNGKPGSGNAGKIKGPGDQGGRRDRGSDRRPAGTRHRPALIFSLNWLTASGRSLRIALPDPSAVGLGKKMAAGARSGPPGDLQKFRRYFIPDVQD